MSKPELTKHLMADTLKKLTKSIPLDKITVRDIVDVCGLNRKTFYYHFQDKQALINWIFDTEFASLTSLKSDNAIINELLEHLYENKEFYMAAITSDVQNSLREHLFKIGYNVIKQKIINSPGSEKISKDKVDLVANYFTHAIIGTVTQWAKEGMRTTPAQYADIFYSMTEECLKFIVNKYIEH